jgi:hypothetical protein
MPPDHRDDIDDAVRGAGIAPARAAACIMPGALRLVSMTAFSPWS